MADVFDLVFRGGTVVNQDGTAERDVAVANGRIAEIGVIDPSRAGETVDCTGLHILPGVIDSHVHFREPGAEHKEDLETGSLAAVMGGVTAVFEMPNTSPLTVSEGTLADKCLRAAGRMHCDFAFWVGGTHKNAEIVGELERLPGAAGIKIFMGSSTGDLLVADDEGIDAILSRARRRVAVHSEDEYRLIERESFRVSGDPSTHPIWRDETAALYATERLAKIARRTGAKIHLLHVTTAEEIAYIQAYKDLFSVEVTPQHLNFDAGDYASLGTRMQINPPIREARHREALWGGLAQGIVDSLGSDHSPHTLEEKAVAYPGSPSGMPGVQTSVPVMLDHVSAGRLTLERFVDLMSAGPSRLFGIAGKGRIAVGFDADLTIVDLKRRETIRNDWIASRAGWTPYDGRTVTGWPVGTVVRGSRVMWEGELVAAATGRPVRFQDTLSGT